MPGTDRKLGRGFGKLWTAATVSGLGDGVTQVAGPLLAVAITRSPAQVAGLMVAQQLPWMLFALPNAAPGQGPRPTLRASMHEGVRWLLGNRLLRTLAFTVAVSDVGLGAVFSVFVLVSRDRLGAGPLGYGLLLAASAVGGIAGGLLADRAVAAFGPGWVLRVELLVEVLTYLSLAVTRSAVIAGVLLGLLGMHLVMFSTVCASLRQSLAPANMLGRVHGAYRLASNSGLLAGAALGGLLSTYFGLTAPFLLGFTALTPVVVIVWGTLNNRDIRTAASPAGLTG